MDFSGPTHKIVFTRSSEAREPAFCQVAPNTQADAEASDPQVSLKNTESLVYLPLSPGTSGERKGSGESIESRWWWLTPKTNQPGEKPLLQFTDQFLSLGWRLGAGTEKAKAPALVPETSQPLRPFTTQMILNNDRVCQFKAVMGCGEYYCSNTQKYENCPEEDIAAGTPPTKLQILLIPRLYAERHHWPKLNSHWRHFTFEDDIEDLDAHRRTCRQLLPSDSHLYSLASWVSLDNSVTWKKKYLKWTL